MKRYCGYQTFMTNGGNELECAKMFRPSDKIYKSGLETIFNSDKKQFQRTVSSIEQEKLKKEIKIVESLLKNDNIWAKIKD